MRSIAVSFLATGLLVASTAAAQTPTPTPDASATVAPAATPEATPEVAPTPAIPATPYGAKGSVTTSVEKLKVGGTIWPIYRYDLSEGGEDMNEFDITRAYVSVYPTLAENLDGRITFDLVPQGSGEGSTGEDVDTNTTGSLMIRLKFAQIHYRPVPMVELTVGMTQTPWIAYEEEMWGYRVLNETAAGTYWGLKSADVGYGVKVNLLNKRLHFWSQVHNGETFAKREVNKYKELQNLVSFQILPNREGGLKAAAFYSYALTDTDADKVRAIGMLSWQSRTFFGEAGYLMAQDGDGAGNHVNGGGPFLAGHVTVPFGLPGSIGTRVLARVDVADPNTDPDFADDSVTRLTAGVAILCHEKAQMVLDYQQESFENSDVDPRRIAFVHWDLRF